VHFSSIDNGRPIISAAIDLGIALRTSVKTSRPITCSASQSVTADWHELMIYILSTLCHQRTLFMRCGQGPWLFPHHAVCVCVWNVGPSAVCFNDV